MSEVPQSPSASKPRSPISPPASYVDLHRELSRLGSDLRKADGTWRRAEESLASEAADTDQVAAVRAEVTRAEQALSAAESAYSWYAKAIAAAGSPPDAVRALAEPLDAQVRIEYRKVGTLSRKMEEIGSAKPRYTQANPPPHMKLIHDAQDALVESAILFSSRAAQQVMAMLAPDRDLYAAAPDRLPVEVAWTLEEVNYVELLAAYVGKQFAGRVLNRRPRFGAGDCVLKQRLGHSRFLSGRWGAFVSVDEARGAGARRRGASCPRWFCSDDSA